MTVALFVVIVVSTVVFAVWSTEKVEMYRNRSDLGRLNAAERYRDALRRATAGRSGRGPR